MPGEKAYSKRWIVLGGREICIRAVKVLEVASGERWRLEVRKIGGEI